MVLCGGAHLNERAVPFVLLSVEREKGEVEDTVAAPVNRTDGRTDGWTDARPWPIVLRSHEFQGRLRQTG